MPRLKDFLFTNTTRAQTVAKNTLWLTFGTLAGRLLRAVFLVIVARALSTEDWGAFTYVLSLSALLSVFIDFGISAIITRESSRDLRMQVRYFATGLGIKGTLIVILSAGTLLIAPHLVTFAAVRALIPVMVLIMAFDGLRDFGYLMTRAWERMELEAAVHVITNVAIVVFGSLALAIKPTPYAVAIGYAAGAGIGIIPAYWPLRGYLRQLRSAWAPELIRPILVSSWPYGMLGLLGALLLNTDTLMIGWLRDLEAVGLYGAAQRVALFAYLIPGPLAAAVFPSMAKAAADKAGFRALLEQALALLTLAGAPLTVGTIVLAGPIVGTLYGDAYLSSAPALAFMAIAFLPYFYSTVLGNAVFAASREKQLFGYVVFGILGNVLLNLLLIPRFGITGSAMGTAINQTLITAYLAWRVRGITRYSFLASAARPAIAALVMGAAVGGFALFSPTIYLTVPVGIIVYAGMLLALREPFTLKAIARFVPRGARP